MEIDSCFSPSSKTSGGTANLSPSRLVYPCASRNVAICTPGSCLKAVRRGRSASESKDVSSSFVWPPPQSKHRQGHGRHSADDESRIWHRHSHPRHHHRRISHPRSGCCCPDTRLECSERRRRKHIYSYLECPTSILDRYPRYRECIIANPSFRFRNVRCVPTVVWCATLATRRRGYFVRAHPFIKSESCFSPSSARQRDIHHPSSLHGIPRRPGFLAWPTWTDGTLRCHS